MSRSNFSDTLKNNGDLRNIFGDDFKKQNKRFHSYVEDIIFLEFMFFSFRKIFGDSPFEYKSIFSMLFGHDEIVFKDITFDSVLLKRVRMLTKGLYPRKAIKILVEKIYFEIPSEWRLYGKDEHDLIVQLVPKYESSRAHIYNEILSNIHLVAHKEKSKKRFVVQKDEDKSVHVPLENGEKSKYIKAKKLFDKRFLEQEHDFPLTQLIYERKRDKKGFEDLNNFNPDRNLYKQMGKEYLDRYEDLQVYKINNRIIEDTHTDFFFKKEVSHVIAPTGAGKGTLTHGLLYGQCKYGKKKILYITADTKQSMQEKEKFEQWGLKVGVIVGDGNIDRYQNDYILNKASMMNHPFEVFHKHFDSVETLSSQCPIKPTLGIDKDTKNPCQNLYLDRRKSRYVCPAYTVCGPHHRFKQLTDADVWIGTPEAFLFSRAPYPWDRYERNYLELGLLWSDLIIMDEVDQIQQRMDQAFLNDLNISADRPETREIDKIFSEYLFNLIPKVVKSSTVDVFVVNYIEKTTTLQQILNYLFGQLFTKQVVIKYVYNKLFTPHSLLQDWYKKHISKDSKEKRFQSVYEKFQMQSAVELMNHSDLWKIAKKLQNVSGNIISEVNLIKEKRKIMNECFKKLDLNPKLDVDETDLERLYVDFELIIFLFLMEHLFKFLRSNYSSFLQRAQFSTKDKNFANNFHFNNLDISKFVPDALTDSFMAYRLKKTGESKKSYSLVAHEYKGVGRSLIRNLPRLLEGVEDCPFPALLILSATSDFGDSSYYGTKISPDWLLENKKQEDLELKITLCPVAEISGAKDPKKAIQESTSKLIRSGFFDEQLKNLKQMHQNEIQALKRKLYEDPEAEDVSLAFERISGEVSPCIGLVVNSYQKAEWVAEVFRQQKFKCKYKVLYTSDARYDGKTIPKEDYHVSKIEVEQLFNEEPEVFIFVRTSLARGFNILAGDNTSRSLLRTIVFYERPHPIPGDFNDVVMSIHSSLSTYEKEIVQSNQRFYDAQRKIQRKAYGELHKLFSSDDSFSNMDEARQNVISTNELVTAIQVSGRGQRGGTSSYLYFLDKKMIPLTSARNSEVLLEDDEGSMVLHWRKALIDNADELTARVNKAWRKALINLDIQYIYEE
ncbi:hypothetical protein [Thermoactinomyces sp. DSM 45892]|uniref:hypothetical protein n=1 Tax=Thermoactinomyces sp. DSM 45892 TaxID=1882753 RepID=UPI0008992EFD|nr:hypothetical protein [Thermoactinomyces sp. DSM 45892]SDX93042.1 hypothetical protein SAMN05444416_10135 [Thermoactinomyces sp. DSM 45892]